MRGAALLLLLLGAASGCVVPPDQTGTTTPPVYQDPRGGGATPPGALTCPQIFQCAGPCTDEACTRACWDQGGPGDRERANAVSTCAAQSGCGVDQACIQARCATPIQMCNAVPAPNAPTPAPPPVAGQGIPAGVAQSPAPPALTQKWGRATSYYAPLGGAGQQGSVRHQYDFRPDGTYLFHAEYFDFLRQEIAVTHEQGTWRLAGDQLTISAQTATGQVFDNGTKQVKKTFEPAKDTVTYRMQFHYFSGIDDNQLVLTPPAETRRDGSVSGNQLYPNAYLFSATTPLEFMTP